MVIRSLVSQVVFSLPLSDKLVPNAIARNLKGEQDSKSLPPPDKHLSQEEKIYRKVLQRRQKNQQRFPESASFPASASTSASALASASASSSSKAASPKFTSSSSFATVATPPSSSHSQFSDTLDENQSSSMSYTEDLYGKSSASSPRKHYLNSGLHDYDIDSTLVPSSASSNFESRRNFYENGGNSQSQHQSALALHDSYSREELSSERVKHYLEEQNEKFDNLINRNIEAVLDHEGQNAPITLQESIYDLLDYRDRSLKHKFQDITTIVGYASARFYPWKNDAKTKHKQPPSGRKDSSSAGTMAAYSPPSGALSPPFTSLQSVTLANVGDPTCVEDIVGSLDRYRKVQLYKCLQDDLDIFEDAREDISPNSQSGASRYPDELNYLEHEQFADFAGLQESGITLDKIQALAILSVRLTFAAIKLAIPISINLYQKFTQNDLFMFNKKNFNAVLVYLIKLLRAVEKKVNGDTISAYQYGHRSSQPDQRTEGDDNSLDDLYNEMTTNATEFLNNQFSSATEEVISKNSSTWQGMALEYVLSRYMSSPNEPTVRRRGRRSSSYSKNDPKYSQYYSKGANYSDETYSPVVVDSGSESGKDIDDNVNILHAAEQFANAL